MSGEKLVGFKAIAAFLEMSCELKLHPDTLRKAVGDERNPLPVEWDQGNACSYPSQISAWRERRKGIRRLKRSA